MILEKSKGVIITDYDREMVIIGLPKDVITKMYSDSEYFYGVRREIQDTLFEFNNYLNVKDLDYLNVKYLDLDKEGEVD